MLNPILNRDEFEKSKEMIAELVAKFDNNKEFYTSNSFKEEEAKIEFINPMFEALGWDVHNKQKLGPSFKEVIFEESLSIGKETKAPDYSFRLGGQLIYYLEAKKPSVNIKDDKSPAYQARRYGWSAKIPIVILTDFEEFAVYETTSKPQQRDKAASHRVLYYTYDEYLDKWEEIYSLFSKDAVQKELFRKFAEDNTAKTKKGTQSIDTEFLKDIEKWRLLLARNIALRNKDLTLEELNLAVQLIIDRIVFFRMAEDRGIERYQTLYKLSKSENIYRQLCEVFKKADLKYNSGLFHFNFTPDYSEFVDNITLHLNIDDGVFKEIFRDLYYPYSPYEFSVISPEILGSIYENFLGSEIRLTPSHQAKVELKPEIQKSGGVYYTPQYIADYIVENTVGELIKDKTPNQISKMKFLDPACGSGSFLLRAYQKLLDYHLDYYLSLKKAPKEVFYIGKDNVPRLTIREKKRILTNNIFGVDIDVNAVEVTKLSLLLKVLEDENKDVLEQQQKLFQEKVLPNLSYNIKCGNSLIGTDILEQDLEHEELLKINPFDWEEEFPEIFKNGGFDAVIGNPPYVRQERIKEMKPYLKEHYETFVGTADLYVYFFEKALSILKENGYLGYISSLTFTKTGFGKKLRSFLLNFTIINFYNHEDSNVFKGIAVKPCVIIINKSTPTQNSQILIQDEYKIYQSNLSSNSWSFQRQEILDLKEKILNKGIPIGKLDDLVINRGLVTGYNKAFIIDENTKNNFISKDMNNKEIIKPILNGKDIKEWNIKNNDDFILLAYKGIKIKNYPLIKEHLSNFIEKLKKRNDKGDYWWELRACAYYDDFEEDKLIYPRISDRLFAVFDDNNHYLNATAFMINSKSKDTLFIKSLCVLFSSNVLNFIFKQIANHLMGGRFELRKIYIQQLPIVDLSQENKEELSYLADKMLKLNKQLNITKTPKEKRLLEKQIGATDQKINQLVYELYDLTDDEIEIIENSLN